MSSIVTRPAGAAVFVEDDGDVDAIGLELAEQRCEVFCLGHEGRIPHELAEANGAGVGYAQQILRVENADDVIHRSFVHGDSRVTVADDEVAGLVEIGPDFDAGHVGSGGHDLANRGFVEDHDRLDHGLL